ncbi:hypothetical protein ACFQFH_12175 [Halobaculum halobium]|uniref:hypothetical protein n=1 Tax=Halobaculum halobium TaxID=3032281 RepID=UPI0036084CA7
MHRPAVPDAYIEEVAERTDFAVDDVRIGLRVLHDAVQDRIVEQYRRARDDSTPNHLLADDAASAWFAFAFADLRGELEAAGYEMDPDLLAAVAAVNMTVFQEVHDRTVSFPRDLADASDTPFFYPVYVAKPDWWREAETRALRALVGLLESGSSPAAALDAWAVDAAGADPDEWAAVRGVDAERVRANAEKAPDPAPEAADGLRAEARAGVPDGPYDPETDRLFVPTTDQLAAAREGNEEAANDVEGSDSDRERDASSGNDASTREPETAAAADAPRSRNSTRIRSRNSTRTRTVSQRSTPPTCARATSNPRTSRRTRFRAATATTRPPTQTPEAGSSTVRPRSTATPPPTAMTTPAATPTTGRYRPRAYVEV